VKTTGDGVLIEFPSVIDAVECAVAVQLVMAERNDAVPEDQRMLFRIGINLGDILIEGDDILGDGVNVAARLESIAEPGGICISSFAYEQVRGKVSVEFTDLGEQALKNIARPIHAYAIGLNASTDHAAPARPSASRLSIVVLPFANMGGDPEQEYFVDGITESLTSDLSRISGAFVIARNTAFTFKGRAVDVKRLGRELNVRYVLEGSVQRGVNRLRVNAQLIDAESGNHLWAERFDKPVTDLFDMQDEIVSRLANALDAQLVTAEARRAENAPHPSSMDAYFQGRENLNKGITPEYLTRAHHFFDRALALDPRNVDALWGAALVDASIAATAVTDDDPTLHFTAAEAAATRAVSLAPYNAAAHFALGVVHILTNRATEGIAECEQALSLDPNLADAHGMIGWGKVLLGQPAETEGHIREALRLSPRDIFAFRWLTFVGAAKLQLEADVEAVGWLRRGIEANRNFPLAHFILAAALALLGRLDEAKAAAQAGLGLNPTFTLRRFVRTYSIGRERIIKGMELAGLPEG
jgi:TolB-like protein